MVPFAYKHSLDRGGQRGMGFQAAQGLHFPIRGNYTADRATLHNRSAYRHRIIAARDKRSQKHHGYNDAQGCYQPTASAKDTWALLIQCH